MLDSVLTTILTLCQGSALMDAVAVAIYVYRKAILQVAGSSWKRLCSLSTKPLHASSNVPQVGDDLSYVHFHSKAEIVFLLQT